MKRKKDILQGTLDLLVLRVLSSGPRHGYGIAKRIEQISDEVLRVQQGSLYPALHRLDEKAFIQATWEQEGDQRPLKMYTLTKVGEKYLKQETESWHIYSAAINSILLEA